MTDKIPVVPVEILCDGGCGVILKKDPGIVRRALAWGKKKWYCKVCSLNQRRAFRLS